MISRRGAVVAAVITALVTLVTSSFTVYFTTRAEQKQQEPSAGSTSTTVTETVTRSPGRRGSGSAEEAPDSEPATSGETVHLADREPDDGEMYWERGEVTVGKEKRPRALTMDTSCSDGYAVGYNIDRGMSTFRAEVGLTDYADSGDPVTFAVRVDGEPVGAPVTVRVGEVAELRADVGAGFRVSVRANPRDCAKSAVLIDPVLLP
ncbi:hypothetical protein FHR84_003765 [Actinopolyspora biskrensis]|uniref:NPCBM/NEW2 domain-containing protein n=1 Tax=Actinopolyspora biskrensis TaxID=1470178 RepID=A0A852Z1L7_9ACTN|nr:hypothetical protein [Actinopolyspora biskrensis]NYH80408.1 hypothetical protein [Actinopolyspora biskrensis]